MGDEPIECENCRAHFALTPGMATDGLACPECGGVRLFRTQPNPVHSEGTLRDMVDSDTQIDQGGNPLGEGTIMGNDGEKPLSKRDNFMHSGWGDQDPMENPWDPEQRPPPRVPRPEVTQARPYNIVMNDPRSYQHPDPWMDNEPGALTYPQHWGSKSVDMRPESLNMETYEMDGLVSLPGDYLSLPQRQARSLHHLKTAGPLLLAPEALAVGADLLGAGAAEAGGAAAAGTAAEAVGAGAAGAGAADTAGNAALQWGKDKAINALKNQATNQIKQRLPGGGLSGLMKGALGAGAGGVGGAAAVGGGGVPGSPGGGSVQDAIGGNGVGWQTPSTGPYYGSADLPMLLLADLETSDSVDSVDEQNDDPHKQDQKQFSDGDKSPSNLKNPNNEDSGASGEDGVREKSEGYGFGPNSPSIDRAMMILPLILHYFQSEESGESDPLIRGLHDMLEQENPGYLQQQHPDGHKVVQEIIQLHKPHPGEHTGGFTQAPGGMVPEKWQQPSGQQPQISSRCAQCGGVTNPDGSCPQCGQGAQTPGMVTMPPRQANSVGPQTPEQKAAVVQYLIDHGRAEEAPNVDLHPEQYAKELAQITQVPNVPPIPDPSQVTPLQPMPSAPGGMPSPDMSQPGGGMQQPMQPMARHADANARVKRCPICNSGSTTLIAGSDNDTSANFDSAKGRCHSCGNIFSLTDADEQQQKEAADSVAPRCPKCGSGSTGLRPGSDGVSAECAACHHLWDLDEKVDMIKYKGASFQIRGLVDVPNPLLQPQQDQGMAWKDTEGNDLMENQTYIVHSAAFPVPDVVHILKVHPDHLDVKIATGMAAQLNPDENQPDFQIKRKEAQLDDYQFTPSQDQQPDADSRNTEPPSGTPGLEQVPPSGPTTDQIADSYPNTTVSHVGGEDLEEENEIDHCLKCGSTMLDHTMRDEYTTLHECVPCGHAWESKDEFQGREAGVDLSWLMSESNDDFFSDMERARAMSEAQRGTSSRSLSSIVAKDPVYQAIHDRLNTAAMQREAGRHFTPGEKRALINEHGRARNLEELDLSNTHYDIKEDYTGKANGLNVREDDLFLGL